MWSRVLSGVRFREVLAYLLLLCNEDTGQVTPALIFRGVTPVASLFSSFINCKCQQRVPHGPTSSGHGPVVSIVSILSRFCKILRILALTTPRVELGTPPWWA
ncbi:hypothetical protein Hdeb2414_s0012g00391971 [Helianthus debilis subsp. tardiflorus]